MEDGEADESDFDSPFVTPSLGDQSNVFDRLGARNLSDYISNRKIKFPLDQSWIDAQFEGPVFKLNIRVEYGTVGATQPGNFT